MCGQKMMVEQWKVREGKGKFCSLSCRSIWWKGKTKTEGTSIEIKIQELLRHVYVGHEPQVPIAEVGVADFLLWDGTIVECDGDYWHSRPGCEAADAARDQRALKKGHETIRLTETDIQQDPLKCMQKIIRTIFKKVVDWEDFMVAYSSPQDAKKEYIECLSRMLCFAEGKDYRQYDHAINLDE